MELLSVLMTVQSRVLRMVEVMVRLWDVCSAEMSVLRSVLVKVHLKALMKAILMVDMTVRVKAQASVRLRDRYSVSELVIKMVRRKALSWDHKLDYR